MNGMMPERQGDPGDVQKLHESFRVFTQVTRNLEQAYRRLESRADGVDLRLREANRRLMEKVAALETVTDELNGILDAIPCGVVTCGEDAVIRRVNPAAETILGRPARELIGRGARTLCDHAGRSILLLGRSGVRPGETVERVVGCLDGSLRCLSGSVADLQDGGRLEILADHTEVAHLRSQVGRLDTLAALGEMAAGVAHEIRNPMGAVEGFAGLLEKALTSGGGPAPAQLSRYADRIRQGVAEVNGIITNLLLWARPERPVLEEFRLQELLGEVRADIAETKGEAALPEMDATCAPAGLVVQADRLKLKLALANLVRNAVEAAGTDGRVRVEAREEPRGLVVTVDDDGPGIAPEARLRLFRPFATTKPEGTGLGLALARKFVELHGGEISAETSPLGGARFALVMPKARREVETG